MPFPISLRPSSRTFGAGEYPVKSFKSQSGVETRILYGNRRTGQTMSLTYENIIDANAELFVNHYDEVRGTFGTFNIATSGLSDGGKTGWNGIARPSFSSQGYTINVPATVVEGNRITMSVFGPTPGASVYWRVSGTGITTGDFQSATNLAYPNLEGDGTLDALGVLNADFLIAADGAAEGDETMIINLYSDSGRANLVAQKSVIIQENVPTATPPSASSATIGAGSYSSGWRYEGPPQIQQVRPGISTVTVNLIGVL